MPVWAAAPPAYVSFILLAAWWAWTWVAYVLWCDDAPVLLLSWVVVAGLPLVLYSAFFSARARRRSGAHALTLLLAPAVLLPAVDFVAAARNYADGTGFLYGGGASSSYPVDRVSRIPIHHTSCLSNDLVRARYWINNTTITVLSDTLGPMNGLYWGPFPEHELVETFVREHGEDLTAVYDGASIRTDAGAVSVPFPARYVFDEHLAAFDHHPDAPTELRVALMEEQLLILCERYDDEDSSSYAQCVISVFVLPTGRFLDGSVHPWFSRAHPDLTPRWQVE